MPRFYIMSSEQEADMLLLLVNTERGYPIVCRGQKSKRPHPTRQQTLRWAEKKSRLTDGVFVVQEVPPQIEAMFSRELKDIVRRLTVEEGREEWFALPEAGLFNKAWNSLKSLFN